MYPLCVGAERVMQAQTIAHMARKLGNQHDRPRLHGGGQRSGALRGRDAHAGARARRCSHQCVTGRSSAQEELEYLQSRGLPVPPFGAAYSINRGLWGVTIGGKETLTSSGSIPDHAWVLTRDAFTHPRAAELTSSSNSSRGGPIGLDGRALAPVALIEALEALAAPFGIGRGIHLGDTIIGTKGRVAFEAPAAEVLLTAHRELEKLVLTGRQQRIKETVAQPYGDLVHEGQLLDPVCRDIEALLLSSQERVTGEVRMQLRPGNLFIEGVESNYSLMAASKGVYGEAAGEWTPTDALGFSKIVALTGVFHRRAGERAKDM